jgi:hypothetical protein
MNRAKHRAKSSVGPYRQTSKAIMGRAGPETASQKDVPDALVAAARRSLGRSL